MNGKWGHSIYSGLPAACAPHDAQQATLLYELSVAIPHGDEELMPVVSIRNRIDLCMCVQGCSNCDSRDVCHRQEVVDAELFPPAGNRLHHSNTDCSQTDSNQKHHACCSRPNQPMPLLQRFLCLLTKGLHSPYKTGRVNHIQVQDHCVLRESLTAWGAAVCV